MNTGLLKWIHVIFIFYPYVNLFTSIFDKATLTIFLTTFTHWYFIKNECFISYICKKLKDPEYKLGTVTDATDIVEILGRPFLGLMLGLNVIIMSKIVLNKKYIPLSLWISFIVFHNFHEKTKRLKKVTANIMRLLGTYLVWKLNKPMLFILLGIVSGIQYMDFKTDSDVR